MTHLVTGATGFVGSALVVELLMRTDTPIVAIVRPRSNVTPTERLHRILSDLIEGHGLPASLLGDIERRVTAVAGDVEQADCAVDEQTIIELTARSEPIEFWHCAASLQYQDRHRLAIERTNIGGTMHALGLARAVESGRFNMVSTAYVAGRQRGQIAAEPGDISLVNNLYEQSKILAEQQVRESGLQWRILRPGVVIGHSATHHTTSNDGMYGFLRGLLKFRAVLNRTQAGLADRTRLRVLADADGGIDLVPVDHVAADAVSLSLADAPIGRYHLTNRTPARIGETLAAVFETVGFPAPVITTTTDEFGPSDRKLRQRLEFYNSYIVNTKHFDRSNVDAIIGGEAKQGFDLSPDVLRSLCQRYVDDYEQGRQRQTQQSQPRQPSLATAIR